MSRLDPSLKRLVLTYRTKEQARRALQECAGRILSAAKRSIFAWQRQNQAEAEQLLTEAKTACMQGEKICRRDVLLSHEGAWRAALEEYCEAAFVHAFFVRGRISAADAPTQDPEIVIGGLSDFTGELARYAVLRATEGDHATVDQLYVVSRDVIELLLRLDLTGSSRSKFDQAKQHLRKLEDIRYDLSSRV